MKIKGICNLYSSAGQQSIIIRMNESFFEISRSNGWANKCVNWILTALNFEFMSWQIEILQNEVFFNFLYIVWKKKHVINPNLLFPYIFVKNLTRRKNKKVASIFLKTSLYKVILRLLYKKNVHTSLFYQPMHYAMHCWWGEWRNILSVSRNIFSY